jgi:hypothetical protein
VSLLAQLSPWEFSLSAWSAAKLKQKADASVAPLCAAVMQHALQSSILADFGWKDWARLLYGLTMAGITCKERQQLQQLFDQCLAILTPDLVRYNPDRQSQNVSNIIYAGARAGAVTSDWQQYVAAMVKGYAAGTAMVVAAPQAWSNIVWACSKLGVYDATFLSTAAAATLQQVEEATNQDASNTLIALASLGWYEPAAYDGLVHAFLRDSREASPQSVCNVLYACCSAQHLTTAVQKVAQAAASSNQQRPWNPQDVSNTLLACSVFALHARDSTQQAPLLQLSSTLFQAASHDSPKRYTLSELCQLWRAHHAARGMGLPCLTAQSRILEAAQEGSGRDAQQLVRRQPLPLQHAVNCAVAATGRYRPMTPSIGDGYYLIQGEVQHKQLGHKLHVLALNQSSYFRYPLGLLTGPARLRVNVLAQHIPVIVVVLEHEWQALGGDKAAQVAHVDRLLQQAEAAIAAAGVPPKQQSGDGGAAQSSVEPLVEAVLVGLPPQEHFCPQENELDGAAAPAIPASGPPQLTPAEAEARLKTLQQQQQAFFKGLPPAPASGLSQGAKIPAQQQQQQPLSKLPQAPALKPPRRPGA